MEYLCNQIGECVGVPVALFYYIEFLDERVFITKNFIKREQPTNLQHICHYRSDDRHDCETLIEVIKKTTGRASDIIVLIDTLLFDALIGNHDRHGRNLAFITSSEGTRLSPIYDNVSYLGLESGSMLKADLNPLGKVATRENLNPSMSDYVLQFCQLGYETHVRRFARKLDIDKVRSLIDASFCSEVMKDAFHRLVNRRGKELIDALDKK